MAQDRKRRTVPNAGYASKFEDPGVNHAERITRTEVALENLAHLPEKVELVRVDLSELKGKISSSRTWGTAIASVLGAALLSAFGLGWKMNADIAKLQGQTSSALNKTAESLLKHSDDPTVLAQANSLVVRASNSPQGIEAKSLNQLSEALAKAKPAALELPQYWRVTSTVVNAKNQLVGRPVGKPNCYSVALTADLVPRIMDKAGNVMGNASPRSDKPSIAEFNMANCSLQLDNTAAFWASPYGTLLKVRQAANPNLKTLILLLFNVEIHYSGGQILPFSNIRCFNCAYLLDVPTKPSLPGQKFMKELLVADLEKPTADFNVEDGE